MAGLNHGGQFSKKLRLENYALIVFRREWQAKIGKVHDELSRRPLCCLSKWVMLPSTCEFNLFSCSFCERYMVDVSIDTELRLRREIRRAGGIT